jgi:hypothetical protein
MTTTTLNRNDGKTVSAAGGKVNLFVASSGEVSAAFGLMGTKAAHKVILRFAGGCSKMTPKDKAEMLDFWAEATRGYKGIAFGGATRSVTEDGKLDPMITDVPALVASLNPGCVAIGTAPRTKQMFLEGQGELVLDNYGSRPNPGMEAVFIIQDGPDGTLDWNGDLGMYFGQIEQWLNYAGFQAAGLPVWNGGGVTKEEVRAANAKKYPSWIVEGSGRAADEYCAALDGSGEESLLEGLDTDLLIPVPKSDPTVLRNSLIEHGFICS